MVSNTENDCLLRQIAQKSSNRELKLVRQCWSLHGFQTSLFICDCLAASFGCDRFRIMPAIIFQHFLFYAPPSQVAAVRLESEARHPSPHPARHPSTPPCPTPLAPTQPATPPPTSCPPCHPPLTRPAPKMLPRAAPQPLPPRLERCASPTSTLAANLESRAYLLCGDVDFMVAHQGLGSGGGWRVARFF